MKRGLIVVFLVLFVSILLLSVVSASWFSDLWNKITGQAVYNADISDCQLCRRYADSNNRLNTPWSCVNFNNTALLTDFTGDVDWNDDFDFKVNCGNSEIKTGCKICRRFNDNCASGCVHNASWSCVNFNDAVLLTDFTKDVNNYDYFDLKVECSVPEVASGCEICRRWADNNLRANVSWGCVNFDGSALETNFINNVNSNDDFDFKVNCNLGAAPTCTENWQCSDWSACSNNQQTRTCTDLNNCGTINNKPAIIQSCTSPVVACYNNSGCGAVSSIEKYCNGRIICVRTEFYICTNPGTAQSSCVRQAGGGCDPCPFGCSGGVCLPAPIIEIDGCNLINDDVKAKIRELQNNSYNTIIFREGERVNKSQYLVIPGKIMKVTRIYNDTSTFTGDEVRLTDVLSSSSLTYSAFITAEGIGTIPIGGMEYRLRYYADKTQPSDSWYITLDFPQTTGNERITFYNCALSGGGGGGGGGSRNLTCTDSDGGKNESVFGTMTTMMGNASFEYSDQCVDNVVNYEGGGSYDEVNSCSGEKCYVREAFCKYDGEGRLIPDADNDELIKCQNGCVDGACLSKPEDECSVNTDENVCLDDVSCYWDQETNGCYKFDETKQLCSDPDDGKNYEVRAHTFGFRNYSTAEDPSRDLRIRTGGKDGCLPDNKLVEYYCSNDYYIETMHAICPVRCDSGTCTEKPCEPRYYCKVEPAICPKSGIQTKQCSDFECDTDYYIEEVQCNPGECSGCELEGKCIPYGFRKKVTIYNNQQGDYKLYCDIDGELEKQKADWQECDNSYECDSNQCSGGECIGVIQMIQNTAKFKVAAIKFVCRLFNLLSPQDYQDCLAEFLGGGTA